ncbi:hypothetical protein [Streptomonospora litoralis]|uniref:Integral membrane protein n=1 Tax=Streptomonospora litoralis TaxID=2498135 RepID=A0A4P6Q3X2_9ACTN|nr:hypothetical protein [Streptomonospora litoralis]QBI53991.1 hypothetical protein EKD16_11030 [Streptomonospora litoralis]
MTREKASRPAAIRAQRVLLWIMAVIIWMNAWVTFINAGGDFYSLGYALPNAFLGVLLALLAIAIRTRRRWVQITIAAVHVIVLLLEFTRVGGGDPLGLVGMCIAVTGITLIFWPSARRFFR